MANNLDLAGITPLGGYLLKNRGPLDVRTVVPIKANLADLATDYYIYEGILVYVTDEGKYYTYTDATNKTWEEFKGSGEGAVAAGTITPDEVVIFGSDGKATSSGVTSTELGHLSGATANIQEQLEGLGEQLDGLGVDLGANTISASGIKYLEDVSYSNPTATTNASTGAISEVSLTSNDSSGTEYVESVTLPTIASTGGTKKVVTNAIKDATLSTATTNSAGAVGYISAVDGGSGSLTSYNAEGTVVNTNKDIQYVHDVTYTAPVLSGITTYVASIGGLNVPLAPVATATPATVSADSGSAGSTEVASYDAGVLTLSNVAAHTHSYDKINSITLTRGAPPTLGNVTTGTAALSSGSITTTKYTLAHTHTPATGTTKYLNIDTEEAETAAAATVLNFTVSGGSVTKKYLGVKTTPAADASVSLSGGGLTTKSTKYFHPSIIKQTTK